MNEIASGIGCLNDFNNQPGNWLLENAHWTNFGKIRPLCETLVLSLRKFKGK